MPRLLYGYILRDLVPAFFVGVLVFTMVLLMDRIMRIVEWIVEKGVSVADVFKLFGCLLPNFFVLTLPTALLLGVLITFSRLYADSELYALKAAGISLYRLLGPVFAFGSLVAALCLFLTMWAGPLSVRSLQSIFYSVATQNVFVGLKERVFFDTIPGIIIYAEHVVPEERRLERIFIADQNFMKEPVYYFAERGQIYEQKAEQTLGLVLEGGTLHRAVPSKDAYQTLRFDRYQVQLYLGGILKAAEKREREMEELTMDELRAAIASRSKAGEPTKKYEINYHRRYALPFGALVFCTLGVPLALLSPRAVRYTGFSLSLVVVLMYFVLLQAGSALVETDILPALVGAWLPNIVLGALGVYLLWKKAEEKPLRWLEAYANLVQDLVDWIRRRLGQTV